MELQQIEGLLERYLAAETSLQEEEALRDYFASGDVAPHLQEYKPLFAYFHQAREERYTGRPIFEPEKKKVYSWVAVAASIVLVAGVFLQESKVNEFGSYEDPEVAMEKTKEALNLLSQMMNTEKQDLMYLQEFDNTKNKILK